MANTEEKISKFVQAITAYAEEQSNSIRKEAEAFKAERLEKAEQQVLQDSYQLIQNESAEMKSESQREMSRRDLTTRREVLSRRAQITDEVFAKARARLLEYTSSSEYDTYLRRLLTEMAAVLPAEGTVYYLSARDASHIEALQAVCPQGSRIDTAKDILIGGLRGVNATGGLYIEDTLDEKLQAQHDWFTVASGLSVG